jgi:hypothetical protein
MCALPHRRTCSLRHARGEVYSKARVAAINAMGPSRESLDESVLAVHARARGPQKLTARLRPRATPVRGTRTLDWPDHE